MNIPGPIIVVDDDPDDKQLFEEVLKRIGVESHLRLFDNGEEALEYLCTTTEKPFIIICDINMPRMNGLEFRTKINDDVYLREKSIPFVFLTTTANADQVREAYHLTVQGFFVKKTSLREMQTSTRLMLEYWKECVHPNALPLH